MPVKIAQSAGQPAILKCAADGAPEVIFTWIRNGENLNVTSDRFALQTWKDVKYTNRYESRLIISHVNEILDYGTYQCKVHNDLGEALFTMKLEKTSKCRDGCIQIAQDRMVLFLNEAHEGSLIIS